MLLYRWSCSPVHWANVQVAAGCEIYSIERLQAMTNILCKFSLARCSALETRQEHMLLYRQCCYLCIGQMRERNILRSQVVSWIPSCSASNDSYVSNIPPRSR